MKKQFDWAKLQRRIYDYNKRQIEDGQKYRKYAVEAAGLYTFLQSYHRNPLVALEGYTSWEESLTRYGYVTIPAQLSVTGDIVAYYER